MDRPKRIRIVLWDVDHTLIESRGMGREIYERIFPHATGQPLRELATVHGRTELDIIHDTLELHDMPATDDAVQAVADALAQGYREAAAELAERGRVLPGVLDALTLLAEQPHVHQTVLTGNTKAVADIKVNAFGLGHYLNLGIGAYGDDDRSRTALVDVARRRAEQYLGVPIEPEQLVVVGDTPHDVAAALEAGAHLIAVASGKYSSDDLVAAGADRALDTLSDTTRLAMCFRDVGLVRA